jgi:hypothetical protein
MLLAIEVVAMNGPEGAVKHLGDWFWVVSVLAKQFWNNWTMVGVVPLALAITETSDRLISLMTLADPGTLFP